MSTQKSIRDRLKRLIITTLNPEIGLQDINNGTYLEDDLGFDSIAILELILGIEKEFNIKIDDKEASAELFKNFEKLLNLVESKLKQWERE